MFPPVDSHLKWLQQPGLGQAEVRNLDLHLGLLHGWRVCGSSSTAPPGALAGCWRQVEQPALVLQLVLMGYGCHTERGLGCCARHDNVTYCEIKCINRHEVLGAASGTVSPQIIKSYFPVTGFKNIISCFRVHLFIFKMKSFDEQNFSTLM